MSSTNKTTYYDLSQYTSNDKPTYLGDYNSDMGKIDAGIHTAKDTADTNATNIGNLTNLTTDSKSTLVGAINEVDSHADTNASNITSLNLSVSGNTSHIGDITNLDTTVKSDLVNAINEVLDRLLNFNLTTYQNLTNISATGLTINSSDLKIAKNSDGSLAKIYGNIAATATQTLGNKIVITGSGLAPANDITINNAGILRLNGNAYSPSTFDITIKTNGNIEIEKNFDNGQVMLFILLPMLYFIKDFGDVPIN